MIVLIDLHCNRYIMSLLLQLSRFLLSKCLFGNLSMASVGISLVNGMIPQIIGIMVIKHNKLIPITKSNQCNPKT